MPSKMMVERASVELPSAIIRLKPFSALTYRRFGCFRRVNHSHAFACVPLKPGYYRGTVMGMVLFGG